MPLPIKLTSSANLICFRDLTGQFGPLTDLRQFVHCRNAALTNFERFRKSMGKIPLLLQDIIHKKSTYPPKSDLDNRLKSFSTENANLFLNERISDWQNLIVWFESSCLWEINRDNTRSYAFKDREDNLIGAWLPADCINNLISHAQNESEILTWLNAQTDKTLYMDAGNDVLASRPWHIQDHLDATLRYDLKLLETVDTSDYFIVPTGIVQSADTVIQELKIGRHPFILPAMNSIDSSTGPIVIHQSALIQPFAALTGPCYVGPESQVGGFTQIRGGTCIGPVCKVAGEIAKSVFQGYSNKAHAGYLGNSLVGEWVNLGADTTVSNLKNNYGQIRVRLTKDIEESSGRQFLGPVIGDYVRTAIGTRLTTGAVIGTGGMIAISDLSPRYISPFSWLTNKQTPLRYDFDKFIQTARTMMARRKCQLSDEKLALLKQIYDESAV